MEEHQSRRSQTIQQVLEKSALARLLLGVAALIGALVTIFAVGRQGWRWYDGQFRWTHRVAASLESLRPNVTVDEFDARLGRPRIVVPDASGDRTQRLYQGRGYWVQAIADRSESVLMFAVTACDRRLHPAWTVWHGRDRNVEIVVNEATVLGDWPMNNVRYEWNISAATANSFVYAHYSAGNATNYLSYAWGRNDACSGTLDLSSEDSGVLFTHSVLGRRPDRQSLPRPQPRLPDDVSSALSRVGVNTFVIYGIRQEPEDLAEFKIGADRVLTRTLQSQP